MISKIKSLIIKKYLNYKLKPFDKFLKQVKPKNDEYHKDILDDLQANAIITANLQTNKPFLVSRLGSGELRCISNYLFYNSKGKSINWHNTIKYEMFNYGGVFPQDDETLISFSKTYLKALKDIDLIGVWNNVNENNIIKEYCPNADLVSLIALEPYFHEKPWSTFLKDKKVLVIHPFIETIKNQYLLKDKLFKNPQLLPDFELILLKSVMFIPGDNVEYNSWNEALSFMIYKIREIDFDVAIIGAGPYGLPLGSYIKHKLNKQAIHLGGASQLLFGIKGKRWAERPKYKNLFNDYWKHPFKVDTPKNKNTIENGCYW